MITKKLILPALILLFWLWLSGCQAGLEDFTRGYRTVVAPPANTLAAEGGRLAGTQAARLLQTAQIKVATESAELRETAKVEAATAAGSLIDTAQARLVTESAGQVTAGPTQLAGLKDTAQALLVTQAYQNLPFLQTQASLMAEVSSLNVTQAVEFEQIDPAPEIQATALPAGVSPAEAEWTIQALAATWMAPIPGTPVPPSNTVSPAPATIVVYHIQPGDRLSTIAHLLRTPVEKLIFLNQLRYPWLASSPDQISAGMTLVVARQPEDGVPTTPSDPSAWSSTPGCDVSRVDWLTSPIECRLVSIDVIDQTRQTLGCISLENPLGYTRKHRVIDGWMLTGADGVVSYGWFIDRGRGAVVVGPAVIATSRDYRECGAGQKARNP